MSSNRTKAATIAFALILTIAATFMICLPAANAHTPPWTIKTWCYITVSPNPIGVGQQVYVVFWTDKVPYTAVGQYGDRWAFTVEVTPPVGNKQTLGPITSDPVGGGWVTFVPDQTGTYTFVAKFPGKTLTGLPAPPPPLTYQQGGGAYINDTYLASTSAPATLVVQTEPIQAFQETPIPTDYWTRPINAINRGWWQIADNWLGGGFPFNNWNQHTTAPKTAHIVWTKPVDFGGIAGNVGDISYYTGSAYEGMWTPPIIIGGRLYYNEPNGPRFGWYCVDLRTGETLWWHNSTDPVQIGTQTPAHISATDIPWMYPRLAFGQVYDYETPNQHGAVSYIWSTYGQIKPSTYSYTMVNGSTYSFNALAGSTTWQMWNAFTGEYVCSIANVPAGTQWRTKDGSILVYQYNPIGGWLALWNSSEALAYPNNNLGHETAGEAYYWMWRPPVGRTVDGRNGYMWNVTNLPKSPTGMINAVLDDKIIGSFGLGAFQYGTNAYSVWALNLNQTKGAIGSFLWRKDYTAPPVVNATVVIGAVSPEDKVGTFMIKETCQWYGYSLDTGEKLWGPSASQADMDMYSMRSAGAGRIAYGKLLSVGWAGIVYCYNVKTGTLLWNYSLGKAGLEAVYINWPAGSGSGFSIADHKIYITTNEHSVTQPIYRDWSIYCVDTETGKGLWNTRGLMPTISIADGYAVSLDGMDNLIYCFGKGQTATTVSVPQTTVANGSSVLIQGTVLDQSPGAKDTPAVSDTTMTAWMEYLYKQRTCPADITGVPVKLEAFGADGSVTEIGTVTSDAYGNFKSAWTPTKTGLYTIMATFAGSDSYFSSYAGTGLNVGPAPAVAEPVEVPAYPDYTPMFAILIVGVVAAIIIGIVNLLRKK